MHLVSVLSGVLTSQISAPGNEEVLNFVQQFRANNNFVQIPTERKKMLF